MQRTILLQDIFGIIKKRIIFLISLSMFSGGIAAILSFYYITPIYEAETQILINQKNVNQDYYLVAQQLETDFRLMNTYNVIINSPAILNKVIEELNLEISPQLLSEKIVINSEDNSKVVNITIQDSNPKVAAEIANTLATVFKEEIPILMNVDNINILSFAEENSEPVKPKKAINITIATFIGLMLGIVFSMIVEYRDTKIKTEKDVEEILNFPIIGIIGCFENNKEKK